VLDGVEAPEGEVEDRGVSGMLVVLMVGTCRKRMEVLDLHIWRVVRKLPLYRQNTTTSDFPGSSLLPIKTST